MGQLTHHECHTHTHTHTHTAPSIPTLSTMEVRSSVLIQTEVLQETGLRDKRQPHPLTNTIWLTALQIYSVGAQYIYKPVGYSSGYKAKNYSFVQRNFVIKKILRPHTSITIKVDNLTLDGTTLQRKSN